MRTVTRPKSARRVRPAVRQRSVSSPLPLATTYVESSALVAALLEGDRAVMRSVRLGAGTVTSALTLAEARRAVVRAHASGRLDLAGRQAATRGLTTFARRCRFVGITADILARAGRPFPVEPIRTLDAVHLATVELLADASSAVTVVTRDRRVQANAEALGFHVE